MISVINTSTSWSNVNVLYICPTWLDYQSENYTAINDGKFYNPKHINNSFDNMDYKLS